MRKCFIFAWAAVLCGLFTAGSYAQKTAKDLRFPPIDVTHYKIDAELFPEDHDIKAGATVEFQILGSTDYVVFELSKGVEAVKVYDEKNQLLDTSQEASDAVIVIKLGGTQPAGTKRVMRFVYEGRFEKMSSFKRTGAEGLAYIGNEGSYLLYAARWFPLNGFLTDRATSELNITVPLGVTVVSTGKLEKVTTKGITETFTWVSNKEILPNLVIAARLFEKVVPRGDLNITFDLDEKHINESEKLSATIEKVVEFYSSKFGAYPFGNRLTVVEVDDSVRDYAGAPGLVFVTTKELEAATFPLQSLARRLAYQWWFHGIAPKSTSDLWLADGFAYYAPTLYMEEKVSSDAFQSELVDLAILALKFENRAPIVKAWTYYGSETYESIVAGKGAWVLQMLRTVMGDENFFKLLRTFATQYASRTATIGDFEKLARDIYGKDLSWFFTEWLTATGVPDLSADYQTVKTKTGFKIRGSLKQDLDLFRMPVEIEIETKGKKEYQTISLEGKSSSFEFETFTTPLRLTIDPKNKILRNSDSLRLQVHIALGKKLFDKGEYVDAIREYGEAIKLNPRSSLAHYRLGETFYEQFNLQSAANSFRDALNGDLKPKWLDVWSHIYLGKIYDILGQRERAKAEYNKAINTKDDTDNAQAEAQKYLNAPFTRERSTTDIK